MRLSEAIRVGATRGPQLYGRSFDGTGASCALGAALLAIGYVGDPDYTRVCEHFPITRAYAQHPTLKARWLVLSIIRDLNDSHYDMPWTREAIADWVETIEEVLR